ncbi:MAG: hypothetical protein EBZ36_06855 [Acidobacteria bacterium]|nr:hypothetical protein [Acidobacteriota bacterium]
MTSNAAGGVASFNGLTASGLVGNNYMLQFTSPGLSSVNSNSFTLTPGAASRLVVTTQPTGGSSGAALSIQPVVAIRDAQGNAVTSPPMAVTASLQSGSGGTLGGITTVNSVNGLATFTGLTLAGATGSNYVLRFSAEGLTPADSGNVTLTAGTATQLMITSQPVGGGSGAALAIQPVVAIRDAQGNPVASSNIPVTVTVQSGTGGVLGGPTTVNAQNGVATFSGLTLTGLVGTNYVLRFAATGLTAVDSTNVTVTAGAAAQLTITTQPVGGASGAVLTTQPVVTIRDAQGNTVTNSTIPVGVTIQQGTGGTLGGGTSVNAVGGVATYAGLTLAGTAGASYVLRFTAAGLPSADSAPVTVVAGSPALLAIATQPVGGPSGQSLSVQPVISIRDAQGNPVTTSTAVVTVGLQSGLGGSIGGTTTVAAVNGVATFSNLTLAGTVGTSYVLRFTSTGLTLVDSASVTVTVGAPTHLAVATQPAGSASGAPFSTQPVIVVRDAQGNTVTTSTAVITAAIGSGSGGSLGGTLSVAAQGGLATFSDLSLAGTVGGIYSLRFTSAGLIPVDSNNLTLTTGSGSQMILTTQPVGGASGAVLAVSPVVAIRDSFGNTVTSATTAVTASLVPGTTGNLTGTTTVNAVNGVATFSNLSLSGLVGTTYSIRFTASNLATVQSANITVTPGAATQLTISTQPLGGASGGLLATQPAVSIRDAQGNLVTSPTVAVTVSLVPGAGGNLLGGTTVNSINGVATFNNLNLSGTVGASYVLRFTAPGLTSTDAAGITVTAGAATQLGVSTQPVAGASGAVFTTPPAITIRDAQGNTVTTSTAAVTVQVTGAGGTLGGATTVNAVGGVATFANLTLTGSTGVNYVLQFSSSGLTSVSSSNVTVVGAGTPAQLAFQAGNNQIATAGALLSTSPGVIVRDGNNNPVQGVTVTFAVASGGGTITGSTPTTGSNGVATVGSWTLGTTAGANTLTATITGLAPVTFTATGVAGPASQLAINAGNNQTALVGAAVAILPSVVVRDANSNPVSGVTVTFSVGAGGGSITGATATSNSSGIASVGSWTLGAVAGTNTLVATSQGLAPVTFTATTGTPPSINAVAGITRAAGTSSSNLTIAYVSDSETPAGNLTVTVTNTIPSTGVAISNIVNTNGTITATVNVDCAVAASAATISLRVSDGSANATTTLTINISANTPPSLGYGAPGQTTPMVSPLATAKEMSSSACTVPPRVRNSTPNDSIDSSGTGVSIRYAASGRSCRAGHRRAG